MMIWNTTARFFVFSRMLFLIFSSTTNDKGFHCFIRALPFTCPLWFEDEQREKPLAVILLPVNTPSIENWIIVGRRLMYISFWGGEITETISNCYCFMHYFPVKCWIAIEWYQQRFLWHRYAIFYWISIHSPLCSLIAMILFAPYLEDYFSLFS